MLTLHMSAVQYLTLCSFSSWYYAYAAPGVISAMVAQNFAAMQFFIKDGASVNTRNAAGWTPLIAAISAGE